MVNFGKKALKRRKNVGKNSKLVQSLLKLEIT